MPEQQSGVEVYKRFYPWPSKFRIGDPVLVREVTGMSWPEFIAAIQAQDDAIEEADEAGEDPPEPDQVVLAGLVSVAFWQGNPQMTRDRARRAIEKVPMEDIEIIQGDEGDDDASPPDGAEGGETPSQTSNPSDASPEAAVSTAPVAVST